MEGFALRRADLVFLDTQTHARRIETLFNLEPGSVGAIWVGAETECFHADLVETNIRTAADTASDVCVLFYGQFIPLHGIETIVHAARIARDEPIQWQLIGSGQETNRIKALLAEQALPKLHWDSWVDYKQLSHRIAAADVCLGIFGTSEKAASVIPNKVFQIVAMGRPLITRDSPAIRELLDDAPPCVYLIPAADPAALVTSIRDFSRQSRSAMRCHTALQGKLDALAIGQQCATLLKSHLGLES
jgi:glycosyltransferase involved in cell wall biosynthesis